ncbi:DUF6064 family protein [Marinobacter nanhaiticus D15-8W]|uniref:MFS transporter permease n=1 Tax=Marinobacter nanhaiticus D15-8W TaxID=626887 RepID=N6W8Q5_9GAMM|nr:hypothetical protein [Marinobacter nanhaiticus]ENO16629.1 hypothetical protein J057_02945 [Marinobacter nanhaiticus D15-8W]BES72428.1 DUF6064 family protein [Marinobacter nanhaiticus D15-8W]
MSYDLRDFLMFTPEVYLRLFERLNDTLGPWFWPVVLAILAIPAMLCWRALWVRRLAVVMVSLGWGVTATLFMHRYYAPINWPVSYFAWAFAVEALVLLAMGWGTPPRPVRFGRMLVSVGLLLGMSLLTAWSAADWGAIALPGLTPDMTALATLVLLAGVTRTWRVLLLFVPLIWCLFSVLTHWALGLLLPMVVPAAGALLAIVLAFWPGPRH